MANNRLLLICETCFPQGRGTPYDNTDAVFAIAKYYPSTGYYTGRPNNDSFNEWLERHRHDGDEYPVRMEYEV